jgi:hypothetical protein
LRQRRSDPVDRDLLYIGQSLRSGVANSDAAGKFKNFSRESFVGVWHDQTRVGF